MALVVAPADGSNTYVDVAYFRLYASSRGETIPELDTDCEALLTNAMDELESRTFKGVKTSDGQPHQFPRKYIVVDGVLLASDVTPDAIKKAQCAIAIAGHAVSTGAETFDSDEVRRLKVEGGFDIEFGSGTSTSQTSTTTTIAKNKAELFLSKYLKNASIRTYRTL